MSLLESEGEDISALYEAVPTSMELLRDASFWLSAHEMELFLEAVTKLPLRKELPILTLAGHRGPQLRAWGVLDSVLRMMPRPQEVFNQPEQFLSYFISPKPPVENLHREENQISFDLPLPAEQYPLVTTYLKAAFESLPTYIGQGLAQCQWENITLKLSWQSEQNSIFEKDPGHQVSPELFSTVIQDLQKSQSEREELQKYVTDLESKVQELESRWEVEGDKDSADVVANLGENFVATKFEAHSPYFVMGQNLARLHDYMVRAQQLVTMIQATSKTNPAVKEAMRRMDWDYVKEQYPRTVSQSMDLLRKMQNKNNENTEG
ncbi:MAG: hypothetical protein ACLGGX_02315 [Bdellovibrionia bacterium]